jgi:hypothetical protein
MMEELPIADLRRFRYGIDLSLGSFPSLSCSLVTLNIHFLHCCFLAREVIGMALDIHWENLDGVQYFSCLIASPY